MQIQYVEDTPADVVALRRTLACRTDISMQSCARIDQLARSTPNDPIDLLLVDIMRPDAESMETDVRIARRVTDAPILFLTGLDPADLLDRAFRAGADGVLKKGYTNADTLSQFADNARARGRLGRAADAADPEGETAVRQPKDWLLPAIPLHAVERPLALLDAAARMLRDGPERFGVGTNHLTHRLSKTATCLHRLAVRSFDGVADCDASAILKALLPDLISEAEAMGVQLTADIREGIHFAALGDANCARDGLQALLTALLERSRTGERLRVSLGWIDDQACLSIASDRRLVESADEFFPAALAASSDDRYTAELHCAAALLALRPEQIRIGTAGPLHCLTLHL